MRLAPQLIRLSDFLHCCCLPRETNGKKYTTGTFGFDTEIIGEEASSIHHSFLLPVWCLKVFCVHPRSILWLSRSVTQMRIGKTWLQCYLKKTRTSGHHMMVEGKKRCSVYLLCLNRFPSILGPGLEKDLICVQGPSCKLLQGENTLWPLVCFHSCQSQGAYCRNWAISWIYAELRALHKRSALCEVHLLPTAPSVADTTNTGHVCYLLPMEFPSHILWGLTLSQRKGKNGRGVFHSCRVEEEMKHVASSV